MLVHWIWYAARREISEWEKCQILQYFQDPEEIFYADPSAFTALGLKKAALDSLADKDLAPAREILEQCAQKDIHICTLQDAAYPKRLRNIPDPPVVLYYKGNLPDMDDVPAIGLVGTRKASAYGLSTAQRMGYQIAKCGAVVVSGMAEGIDGAGTKGALMAEGTVVGVLGSGPDIVYPAFHKSLFADTQRMGCLISEYPPGTPPVGWHFPRRNRIISGLSCGVLVVEAPERSGSLITAREASEQGRDVFVVPGNIDVSGFVGSNALLKEGAAPATCGWDVVGTYSHLYPGKVGRGEDMIPKAPQWEMPMVAEKPIFSRKKGDPVSLSKKKSVDKPASPPYSVIRDSLSPQQQKILEVLEKGDALVDEIVAATGMPAAQVLQQITLLQIKGIVISMPGNRVKIKE